MTHHHDWFTSVQPFKGERLVLTGDDSHHAIQWKGTITIQMSQGEDKDLSNVLLVPGITKNLISVGQIVEKGYEVKFNKDGCYVKNDKGKVVAHGEKNGRIFKLKMNATHNANFSSHSSSSSLILWHKRLGHISHQSIMHLKKEGLVEGLPTFQVNEEPNLCPSCQFGKQQRRRFNKSTYQARQPLELIHSDVWGPSQTTSMGGDHYFLTFVDDMSRKVWVYFLKNKSEVFSCFKQSKAMVEKECGRFIKTFRSDQGGEFKSKEFEELCWNQGIRRQYTCAYTPQQNGVAERKNRVIVEHARAMLNEGNLPKLYWAEAVNTSVHLMNMSPTEALTRLTPEEAYSGIKPNVSTLKVFGCVAYMHILDEKRRKLDVKSERCVFTGYDMYSKGYRLVNPDTNKIHISRDVIFDESDRWFKNTSSSYEEVSMEVMDEWRQEFENWTTEEEDQLKEIVAKFVTLFLPGYTIVSIEEMTPTLATAAQILRRLPSELAERVVLEHLSKTGFVWKSGNTLHVQGWLLLQQGGEDDLTACYIAVKLGLVQVLKLTTYVIQPVYFKGNIVGRKVNLISKDQFKLFQEIARGAVLELEDSDEVFLWSYKFGDYQFQSIFADYYDLEQPHKDVDEV
ncbi:hypothetical protein L7F22_004143 [Adiantum nelumboides]|nr:hypothetical protein [Adiantum nelumboides]